MNSEWLRHWDACRSAIDHILLQRFLVDAEDTTGLPRDAMTLVSHPVQQQIYIRREGYNLTPRCEKCDPQKGVQWIVSIDMPEDELRLETSKGVCVMTNLDSLIT